MSDNGILAAVPGEYVAAAQRLLPPPGTPHIPDQQVEIDAGHAGMVRLFYRAQKAKHGRNSHFYWSAYRAEAMTAE